MKIILSRKGFDGGYGGQPSAILPDGTLLSFPIPIPGELIKYDELFYKDKSYLEIIRELRPTSEKIQLNTTAHLDPDLRKNIYNQRSENWKPAFGQCDAAQGALRNNQVSVNDIFLFFGWFKQTEIINGKLKYKYKSPDLHLIYGYLQIGEINKYEDIVPEYLMHHPHSAEKYKKIKSNCIYIARDELSFNENLNGADILKYNPALVLTKKGETKSKWKLPAFFQNLKITYHNETCFKENYFQSRAKGQEFIIETNEDLLKWTKNIIENN